MSDHEEDNVRQPGTITSIDLLNADRKSSSCQFLTSGEEEQEAMMSQGLRATTAASCVEKNPGQDESTTKNKQHNQVTFADSAAKSILKTDRNREQVPERKLITSDTTVVIPKLISQSDSATVFHKF